MGTLRMIFHTRIRSPISRFELFRVELVLHATEYVTWHQAGAIGEEGL